MSFLIHGLNQNPSRKKPNGEERWGGNQIRSQSTSSKGINKADAIHPLPVLDCIAVVNIDAFNESVQLFLQGGIANC